MSSEGLASELGLGSSPSASSPARLFPILDGTEAPQFADLVFEATLMGQEGHDPWFDVSHPIHDGPLYSEDEVPETLMEMLQREE
eukprot:CAMPEP_0182909360 /NCGR_PEP_ID=MMETSP0034_2-20130328/35711_1 /TAXON_ID=156128 /ORGANISM="Nephroselmis pyriformis, Strain CCMP717" /LENGTH=84 /DNA_ID=CAMNT_0025045607 /DNA_START=89 /DNA_END=340 /DNA_ORIENTATION=+